MAEEFTHLTDSGVHMVEVGGKPDQKRRAIASGSIFLDKHTVDLIQNEEIKKGNPNYDKDIEEVDFNFHHFPQILEAIIETGKVQKISLSCLNIALIVSPSS